MRLVALGAVIALLGAIGTLVYAALLRYRGTPIPRWTVRLGCGLLGAGHSFGFLYLPDLTAVVPFLALPAIIAYLLFRRGHRVAAGTTLIGLGLGGALWWGGFLVQDALDPSVSYDPVLWLWWAPEIALIVAGALLVVRGDRSIAAPLLFAQAATHRRDPTPIGSAILRATSIGRIPISVLVGVGVALLVCSFAVPWAVEEGVPWPIGLLAGAVAFTVIGVELGYLAIPRRARSAWQGHALVASPETKRWVATTGSRVPTSLLAMRRWLAHNPERSEMRWAHAQVLILTGEMAEARAVIERMPVDTAWERFEQHTLQVYLDWVEGGEPEYEALGAHAETVGEAGSAERLAAHGEATIAVARDLAASGGDWMAPLIALRDQAGPEGQRLLRNDLRRISYPWYLLYGLIACGFVLFTSGLLP